VRGAVANFLSLDGPCQSLLILRQGSSNNKSFQVSEQQSTYRAIEPTLGYTAVKKLITRAHINLKSPAAHLR
jgi:hypothetical protein